MTNATRQYVLDHPNDDAATIRTALTAMPLTVQAIPLKGLTAFLRLAGLEETLPQHLNRPEIPTEAREGLGAFLRHVGDVRQDYLDTTDLRIAAMVAGVLGALVTFSAIPPDAVGAIYALGGGMLYDVPSEDEIAAVRASAARDATALDLRGRIGRASVAVAERVAAFERGEAASPTADELATLFAGAMS